MLPDDFFSVTVSLWPCLVVAFLVVAFLVLLSVSHLSCRAATADCFLSSLRASSLGQFLQAVKNNELIL